MFLSIEKYLSLVCTFYNSFKKKLNKQKVVDGIPGTNICESINTHHVVKKELNSIIKI